MNASPDQPEQSDQSDQPGTPGETPETDASTDASQEGAAEGVAEGVAEDEAGGQAAPRRLDPARYEGVEGFAVREVSQSAREVLAVVPRERYDAALDAATAKLARRVQLKGFRKGKAPKSIVRKAHGTELAEATIEELVNEVWAEVARQEKLRAVAEPQLTELALEDGEPLRFALRVEVIPEVELKGLDEIRPESKEVTVTDEDVDREVEKLREIKAELVDVDRDEAQPGDHALIDLERWPAGQSRFESEPEEKREDLLVEVGAEGNLQELDRALLGMKVGERRQFETKYPESHEDEALRGVDVAMAVTLKKVQERRIPELTDELVAELSGMGIGEWKSVEELRSDVRERLGEAREEAARRAQDDEIVRQLVEKNPVEIPRTLVEKEAEMRLRDGIQNLEKRGIDPSDPRIDWRGELEKMQAAAERDLRAQFLLDLVAEERAVEVGDAEVDEEIERIAKQRGKQPREMRQMIEKSNQINSLRAVLRRRLTLDSLRSGATISRG